MKRASWSAWHGATVSRAEAGGVMKQGPHVKRADCTECVAGDHFRRHTEIGCIRPLTPEGHICGCTIPADFESIRESA